MPDAPLLLVLTKLARSLGNEDRLILTSRTEVPAQITDAARRQHRLVRITDFKIDESEFPDFERSVADGGPLTRGEFRAALRHSGNWMTGLPLLQLMGMPASVVHEKLADLLAGLSDAERAALVATALSSGRPRAGLGGTWGKHRRHCPIKNRDKYGSRDTPPKSGSPQTRYPLRGAEELG